MRAISKTFVAIFIAFTGVTLFAQGNSDGSMHLKQPSLNEKKGAVDIDIMVPDFFNFLETIPYYSTLAVATETQQINDHISNLRNYKDKETYIKEHRLRSFYSASKDTLDLYRRNINHLILNFWDKYNRKVIINRDACNDSLYSIVNSKLQTHEKNLELLKKEMDRAPEIQSLLWHGFSKRWILFSILLLTLLVLLILWFRIAYKRSKKTTLSNFDTAAASQAESAIVVRRKTTSILRKQSLEDVIGNDAYLKIDSIDFCEDSAVRRMYIKNTCIKDIYNMYAEDLRNPDNPKEDGCMVLGRWVFDNESHEYYVSLEHIVTPGDDAVFSEYELNFGGKIKLKVTEKLRKLRRETNLQYDLTCWVHSHPGLGVFFSNSDNNVQMQLKHPTHPNFLTAIVVDILTPEQEMGIFTFKRDSTINSKADLKKLYSLEDMYKWAVESDRNAFKSDDYYNTLANAQVHNDDCYGIELSNGAIIDMGMLTTEGNSGLLGLVHGFTSVQDLIIEHVAVIVSKNESVPDNELIGCFVSTKYCSIPTIRKTITPYIGKIRFVLVYSTTDGMLTSIPVVNGNLATDEKSYGEQKLEELKIWTRRRR